ncbi:MAG: cupin domain-containing protein [Bradyrhizobium sp.]|uniref:cupin domain-containing protein n=1 Tax=Bradyrhizobium sp. TaxID=376 RepID=UPI00272F15CC|nr:cupin domain-containing protein [Bradyrhizobium sp.]MDP1866087.1 cupin domain-containing protein [Bradyrhizobium sp.]
MRNPVVDLSKSEPLRDDRYGTVFELSGSLTEMQNLGFAWVEVDVGAASPAHFHKKMSELYHVVDGTGVMTMDGVEFTVSPGQCVSIQPGVVHSIRNSGSVLLRFFCATSPAYTEDDDYEV